MAKLADAVRLRRTSLRRVSVQVRYPVPRKVRSMWYMKLYFCRRRRRWILDKIWNENNKVVHNHVHKRKQASKKLARMIAKVPKCWEFIAFKPGIKAKAVLGALVHLSQLKG